MLPKQKTFDFDDRLLLALSDSGTRRPAEVVEQSAQAGVFGLIKAWR